MVKAHKALAMYARQSSPTSSFAHRRRTFRRGAEPREHLPVIRLSSTGGTPMWKSMLDEAREVVWLASIVGGLSAIGVGLAVVVAVA